MHAPTYLANNDDAMGDDGNGRRKKRKYTNGRKRPQAVSFIGFVAIFLVFFSFSSYKPRNYMSNRICNTNMVSKNSKKI